MIQPSALKVVEAESVPVPVPSVPDPALSGEYGAIRYWKGEAQRLKTELRAEKLLSTVRRDRTQKLLRTLLTVCDESRASKLLQLATGLSDTGFVTWYADLIEDAGCDS